jgi:hypothetical protein
VSRVAIHEQIEDEDLIKFDLFTLKEVALVRVRSLQVSIVRITNPKLTEPCLVITSFTTPLAITMGLVGLYSVTEYCRIAQSRNTIPLNDSRVRLQADTISNS